jgi:hypothetical protein
LGSGTLRNFASSSASSYINVFSFRLVSLGRKHTFVMFNIQPATVLSIGPSINVPQSA